MDVPEFDDAAEAVLRDQFHAHPMVVKACRERNFVPSVHGYEDHTFVIVHTPLAGEGGHVHMLELDQLVGRRYLVTVHGPRNPAVSLADATEETRTVPRTDRGPVGSAREPRASSPTPSARRSPAGRAPP